MSLSGPVVHVIAPSPAGGAESVVVALAAAVNRRTHAVILNQTAGAGAPPFPLVEQLRRRGVAVEELRCGRRQYRAEIRAVEQHLAGVGARLVHTHGYHGTWVGYHAAKRLGIPTVATVHGYLTRSLKERLYNFVDRQLLRRVSAVIAVSTGIRDQLISSGIAPAKVHLIQNGLASSAPATTRAQARTELGLSDAEAVIGWIGRLSREKGPDLFLRALALSGSTRGVIVGEGPEKERLTQLSHALGLAQNHRVIFAGYRPEASGLLPAFDALALTSRMEGTPMVILEAVAAGTPIVAFAIGGIPDLLDNDTAWLVPSEDVAALGAAFTAAVGSPRAGRDRAAAARSRLADVLATERWVQRVWGVYDQVAEEAQPR